MANKITEVAESNGQRHFLFECPGCETCHAIWLTDNPNPLTKASWTWNGSFDKPTANPSILVTPHDGTRCHSYMKDGMIQFLSDCTHKLAGQTVELPDWDRPNIFT